MKKLLIIFLVFALLCTGCAATEEPLTPLAEVAIETDLNNAHCPEAVQEYSNEADWPLTVDQIVPIFFGTEIPVQVDGASMTSFNSPDTVPKGHSKTLVLYQNTETSALSGRLSYYANANFSVDPDLSVIWDDIENRPIIQNLYDPVDRVAELNAIRDDSAAWLTKLQLPEMECVYVGYLSEETQCQLMLLTNLKESPADFHSEDCWMAVYQTTSGPTGYAYFLYTKDGLNQLELFSYGSQKAQTEYAPVSVRQAIASIVEQYRGQKNAAVVAVEFTYRSDDDTNLLTPVWHFVIRTEETPADHPNELCYVFTDEYVKMKDGTRYQFNYSTSSMMIPVSKYQSARSVLMGGGAAE